LLLLLLAPVLRIASVLIVLRVVPLLAVRRVGIIRLLSLRLALAGLLRLLPPGHKGLLAWSELERPRIEAWGT
jgi:hypothetical protein